MAVRLEDALGRTVELAAPAARVVSLVPSETESVVALAGLERLVGRTEWCEEPAGRIEAVPTVGGTKKIDVDAVLALEPDLVLANREENGKRDVERLIDAGVPVHVSLPKTPEDAAAHLRALAAMLGVDDEPARALEAAVSERRRRAPRPVRVFAPIWKDPWMTFDDRTYGGALLALLGGQNVYRGRPRRFPLAADLGDAPAREVPERDTRYPRTSVEEIVRRAPELVLLPDEPFRFDESHVDEVRAWGLDAAVELVCGKDLFWYGVRTLGALERLGARLDAHRTRTGHPPDPQR
ncbi:MAG TPA: helical backbone metal receptor [Sandaracinaceae bacterium LLY-WYZ-13_1]|nr:helical backbone metal receptor [Sandaracinaceae bacterium LLY-WYZ-13_1]